MPFVADTMVATPLPDDAALDRGPFPDREGRHLRIDEVVR